MTINYLEVWDIIFCVMNINIANTLCITSTKIY